MTEKDTRLAEIRKRWDKRRLNTDDIDWLLSELAAKEQKAERLWYDSSAMVNLLQWWLRWEAERFSDNPVAATVLWLGKLNSRQESGLAAAHKEGEE